MTGDMPSFESFYAAIHGGRAPFPWQSRLARQVSAGGWPVEIGIPTGLGKTSCIDIAVWALAAQADRPAIERTLPTRVWYVVNRRLLVDAAYEHGSTLHELLHSTSAPVEVRAVAERLRSIGGFGDEPLAITRLRGGAELGARPPHPAQPAIVFATVPMFASTWLFRGYASSRSMRPVDAAHAGIDALVLLDEAHLARPLQSLLEPVAECDVGDPERVLGTSRARLCLSSLTATGDAADPFVLDASDHADPVVRRRLDAAKSLRLVEGRGKAKDLGPQLAAAVVDELSSSSGPVAVVVFANTPARARAVFDQLCVEAGKKASPLAGTCQLLLTGRMRRQEADQARTAILDPATGAPSDRDRSSPRSHHLVVVSTQTLEVGADLDFDVLITESCGSRALIQRLGRLNRLGLQDDARGRLVHPVSESEWEVYGTEPARVWERLCAAADPDGIVHLPPAVVGSVLGEPEDQPPRVGELLPAHLWEWAKTTTPPPGEAPVELFFEGFASEGPRLSLLWRATRFQTGDRLVPSVHVDETIELPLWEAVQVLRDRLGSDATVTRLAIDKVTVEEAPIQRLRPNDVVVLHVTDGMCDEHGWAPESTKVVPDVSIDRWPGLPVDVGTAEQWIEPGDERDVLIKLFRELDDLDMADVDELASLIIEAAGAVVPRPVVASSWHTLVADLRPRMEMADPLPFVPRAPRARRWRESLLVAADAFDDLSATASSARLDEHLASVGEIARRLAETVGMPPQLTAAVEAAGRFHDLGKADPRFQRWLDPAAEAETPLAKSSLPRTKWRGAREASGWPEGGRHESLSARMVERWLEEVVEEDANEPSWDRDLVVHLVISHHGYGRPLVPPVRHDGSAGLVSGLIDDHPVDVCGDLTVTDWDQPARFRRCCERYGYWGLALLEAIVRQADHLASSQISARGSQAQRPVVA